jgi:hypothetical protein
VFLTTPSHAVSYSLKVTARHAKTSRMVNVVCRFSIVFGRQEKIGGRELERTTLSAFQRFGQTDTSAICPHLMQKDGLSIKSSSQGRRKISSSRACQLLQTHRGRLKQYFKDAGIELISQQFSNSSELSGKSCRSKTQL